MGISKLRGRFHEYRPLTKELFVGEPPVFPALATYHPSYLLRTPSQKRLVWQDMLMFQEKRGELGLLSP
jgi:DNA polymerase